MKQLGPWVRLGAALKASWGHARTQAHLPFMGSSPTTHRVVIRVQVGHEHGGQGAQDPVHLVPVVTAKLPKRAFPTVQEQGPVWAAGKSDSQAAGRGFREKRRQQLRTSYTFQNLSCSLRSVSTHKGSFRHLSSSHKGTNQPGTLRP